MSATMHRGELYEGPDSLGRYSYALFWWTDYSPGHPDGEDVRREKGQHFFGRPPDNVLDWTDHRGRGITRTVWLCVRHGIVPMGDDRTCARCGRELRGLSGVKLSKQVGLSCKEER